MYISNSTEHKLPQYRFAAEKAVFDTRQRTMRIQRELETQEDCVRLMKDKNKYFYQELCYAMIIYDDIQ